MPHHAQAAPAETTVSTNRNGIMRIMRAGKPVTGSVAAIALAILMSTWPNGAGAQTTQQKTDPRRVGSAKVTQQVAPQSDIKGENDEKQVDDSYQPKGIEVGSFLLLPQIEVEESYNSNVFARSTQKKDDFITRVAPEFQLRSRFSNHMLNVAGRVEQHLFRTYTHDNHLDASLNFDGRYDFSREWEGTAALDLSQRSEDRGSPDDQNGREPARALAVVGRTGSKIQLGRFTFSGELNGARRRYGDVETSSGGAIPNADRNRWEMAAIGRGSYEIFPGYSAVVEMQGNRRQYDQEFDRNGYQRSSTGMRAEAGIGVDISQLIRGDFLVGYMMQDYEDRRFNDPTGLSLKSVFNWTPTRLTVVVLSLERTVQETTTERASGMIHTGGSLLVRHEFQRNIVGTGTASVFQDVFDGAGQTNWTFDTRARLVYALVPEAYVGGELGFRRRISDKPNTGYDQTVALLRVGLRM